MVTAHARSLGRRRLVRSPRDPGTARRHPARTLCARRAPGARRAAGLRRQGGARARRARARLRPGDGALGRGRVAAALRHTARLLARAAHWAVILFAIATALTHLGIGKEMVLVAFGITFGGLVLALALAFGLGGRAIAADILARRLRRESSPPPQERLTHL